jgi:cytochrome c5
MRRLALMFAAIAAIASACRRPSSARESRDFERMRRQQRYDPYDVSRFFPNGATMQAPPPHTVSRGLVVGNDRMPDSHAAAQFTISCAPCHGAGGFGGGPIAPNLTDKRPPSLRSSRVASLPDSQLIAVVTEGFGRMPPLGWQLTPGARAAVARYVRTLPTLPTTDAMRADSTMAAYLQVVDSLLAAGANVREMLRLRASRR